MNKFQRQVLQQHQVEMTRSVYVDTELLGKFYQSGLLDSIGIDSINIETENENRVTRLLDLLHKHPDSEVFDKFVKILESKTLLLANSLRSSLEELNNPKTYEYVKTKAPVKTPRPVTPSDDTSVEDEETDKVPTEELTLSPFDLKVPVEVDTSARQKLCFNCLRNLCPNCQIKIHSNESLKIKVPNQKDSGNKKVIEKKEFNKSTIKQILIDMCVKKKIDVGIFEEYSEIKDSEDMSTSDVLHIPECQLEDTSSPTSILNTFNFLERQINSLLNKIKTLEDQNLACYELFDDKNKTESLTVHINKLMKRSAELEEDVEIKTAFADDLMKERKIEEKLKKVMMKEKEEKINELQQVNLKLQKDYEKLNNRLEDCEKSINNRLGECEKTVKQSSVYEAEMTTEQAAGKRGQGAEKQYINEGPLQNQATKSGYTNDASGQHSRFQAKIGLEKTDIARLQELQAARERNKALLNKKPPNARNYITQRSLHDLELPKIDLFQEVTSGTSNVRVPKKGSYYQSKFASYY